MSGGILIARSLWDDAAFQNEPFSEREAWVWMIAEASWKSRQKRVGNVIVTIDRGQLAHSTRFLSEAWKWTHSKVRRFLDRLEMLKMIERKTDTGVSVITLCKYNEYQLSPQARGTVSAQKRHSSGTNENKGEIRMQEGKDTLSKDSAAEAGEGFWNECILVLTRAGRSEKQARALLGKWTKTKSRDAVKAIVLSVASDTKVADPAAMIEAKMKPPEPPDKHSAALSLIATGNPAVCRGISARLARELLADGKVTEAELKKAQVDY